MYAIEFSALDFALSAKVYNSYCLFRDSKCLSMEEFMQLTAY